MNRSNVSFIRQQLLKSITQISGLSNYSDIVGQDHNQTFKIQFDQDEMQNPKTNMDDIMYHYAIPDIANKLLTLDEVCDKLITGKNELPLWIKLSYLEEDKIFMLRISKRFRNKKVVEEWHRSSDILPIIIDNEGKNSDLDANA